MARKKVREYDAKKLLKTHLARLGGLELPIKSVQVNGETDFGELIQVNPWLSSTPLVVKPDMLFGQRGKLDLVGLNLDFPHATDFIKERLGKVVTVKGCTGPITTFVVEPFVPHEEEYYLCIQTQRLGCEISFSDAGGVEVESNWDKLKTIFLDTNEEPDGGTIAPLIAAVPLESRPALERFILACIHVFQDLDMTLLEMNPFTLDPASRQPFPLDARMELDDTARFRSGQHWGNVEFPLPFGRVLAPAEETIARMDEATGASLKFTVLNPHGRVWLMVAGGGASVIYTDTVADLGYAQELGIDGSNCGTSTEFRELGNYGEYSGAPNTAETYQYARVVLNCVAASADGQRGRALLIGGGIANFTDVAATFTGIIQALRERSEALKAAKVEIWVRRGGPNYTKGLDLMRAVGKELGLAIHVYGPETSMTGICAMAIDYVKSFD